MKRRISAFLLALFLLLPLAACARGTGDPSDSTPTTSDTAAPDIAETDPPETEPVPFVPVKDGDPPVGHGIGVNPGRVTWAYNPNAFTWNGKGYWWLQSNFDAALVKQMLTDTICTLAGKDDVNAALDALFKNYNKRRTGEAKGYTPGEKIVVKVNLNVTGNGDASDQGIGGYYPSPVTMRALCEILVESGVAAGDITLTDPSRNFPTYVKEIIREGALKDVRLIGYNDDPQADTSKQIVWSHDLASDGWPDYNGYPTVNPTFWSTDYTEATYMINLFNLRGHNLAGFTASAKNHFGSLMPAYESSPGVYIYPEGFRTNPPSWAGVHHYVAARNGFWMNPVELWDLPKVPLGSYTVLVDLLSNADAGGKTFLYLCDGLAATVHQGSNLSNSERWYSAPFGDGTKEGRGWTNSIFASQDPIAIDSVMLDFLLAERDAAEAVGDGGKWQDELPHDHTADNYLLEAAQADDPPSGTVYRDGCGNPVGSLGVHEHWDNAQDKQYSRNLGGTEGIELIRIDY